MRSSLSFFAAAAALLVSAAGVAHALPNSIDFVIKKGEHSDRKGISIGHMQLGKKTRTLSFQILFPNSAAYRTASPANQSDACKAMGFTTANIHGTSNRLGWAWNPATNKMTLRLYAYVKGQRINEKVTEVPLNVWTPVVLKLGNDGVSAQVGSAVVSRSNSPGFGALSATWVLKTVYFGGNETAPHDISVHVRNISVR